MRTLALFLLFCLTSALPGQINFDKYFTDKVLRFDFMLAGNSQKTPVYPVGMKEEPFWAGSKTNLINPFNSGTLNMNSLIPPKYSYLFQRVLYAVSGMADNC